MLPSSVKRQEVWLGKHTHRRCGQTNTPIGGVVRRYMVINQHTLLVFLFGDILACSVSGVQCHEHTSTPHTSGVHHTLAEYTTH